MIGHDNSTDSSSSPIVSVIIPTLNEAELLPDHRVGRWVAG
jgi:hypothetical protein